jgi:hypothetical protein
MTKPKIFVSAYACEPDLGSEIGVGWHWVNNGTQEEAVHKIIRKYLPKQGVFIEIIRIFASDKY